MQFRKTTLLFLINLISIFAFGQKQRASLTERVKDDKIKKSLAIIPVYRYHSTSIEPYTMFGVKEKPDQKNLEITKLPVMENMRDTGYSFIYFSGADNEINKGYCLALVTNFKRSVKTVYFYIDKNNNLDFTDDGDRDSVTYMQSSTTISFPNPDNPKAKHFVKLTRIQYGKNIKYKRLLTEHYKKHSGTKDFVNINYCFREQRLNTIGGVYTQGKDSFMVALKDMNNDGLFNESCTDRFYVGAAGDLVSTDIMSKILPNTTEMYFEWNKKRYRILNIEPSGQYIDFEEVKDQPLVKELKQGKKVPNFSFVTIANEKRELKEFKKKKVYIFFWDKANISQEDTLYLGKIHREFGQKVELITLNHGDIPRQVRIMHFYDNIGWPIAFSSVGIGRTFYVEQLNKGVYLAKKCKLQNDNLTPKQMFQLLSNP